MKRNKLILLSAFSLFMVLPLASCSCDEPTPTPEPEPTPEPTPEPDVEYSETAKITVSNPNMPSTSKVYNPEDVTITMDMAKFEDQAYYNTQFMPSTGDVKILVVPVLIPGYSTIDIDNNGTDDKNAVHDDIEELFFGDPEKNDRLKFGSVKSFYEESSYGKLNITGEVMDWFNVSSELGYTSATQISSDVTTEIMGKAVEKYRSTQSDGMQSFDTDDDGFIDAVWLVYSAPNYTNGGPNLDDYNYWAYTSWANQDSDGNLESPVANVYGWASYDFMYEGYETSAIDSHTFNHETGHFLGLQDYYSTDGNAAYSPLGKVDMMDNNIIDHNSYSKMLLGWTKPYLVYGSGEIDLKSMQNENAFIVIQSDDAEVTNEFNPFSEYILIELYTNEGLNEIDSYDKYEQVLAPQGKGVRIYHINKSLYTITADDRNQIYTINPYDGEKLNDGLVVPITNSRDADVYNNVFGLDNTVNLFDEIRFIESDGKDTFSNGGYQTLRKFFKNGSTFKISNHANIFQNGKLDNGKALSYEVGVSYEN